MAADLLSSPPYPRQGDLKPNAYLIPNAVAQVNMGPEVSRVRQRATGGSLSTRPYPLATFRVIVDLGIDSG